MRKIVFPITTALFLAVVALAQTNPNSTNKAICPEIAVAGPSSVSSPSENIAFEAYGVKIPDIKITYDWKVSSGEIISGQHTSRIYVRTAVAPDKYYLTATIKIVGLPPGCQNTASDSFPVERKVLWEPDESYGEATFAEEKIRLDNFMTAVMIGNNMKGYILKDFERSLSANEVKKRIERIKKFLFSYRKYPKNKIEILVKRADPSSTTLVRWPAGENLPFCPGCKPY